MTTNSVEGFFGVFKRGFNGVYRHCGEQHFQRYLDEYTFRYNDRAKLGIDDAERAQRAIKGADGKRLASVSNSCQPPGEQTDVTRRDAAGGLVDRVLNYGRRAAVVAR